jgi:Icc-related predicted phosphoesterase
MKAFIFSDLHYDYYRKEMSIDAFVSKFIPADILIIPGDIASKFNAASEILKRLCDMYKHVVFCLGNHDMTIHVDNGKFKTTEDKIDSFHRLTDSVDNLHMLDGNVENVCGVSIGGCSGIWDYTYLKHLDVSHRKNEVDRNWLANTYDGKYWNYMDNDISRIREKMNQQCRSVLAQKPDVMVTHFAPINFRVPNAYECFTSVYYYFSPEYIKMLKPGSIWCAGHTHTAYRVGNLYINPIGYPHEEPYGFNSLKKEDFVIELFQNNLY